MEKSMRTATGNPPLSVKQSSLGPEQKARLKELLYTEEVNGERRVNRILLFTIGFLVCLLSVTSLVGGVNPNMIANLVGFSVTTVYAAVIFFMLRKGIYGRFVKYLTVTLMISMVTISVAGYSIGSGWAHTLRTCTLIVYFLVISMSGFYQNPGISIYAGILAGCEYAALFMYAVLFTDTRMTNLETFDMPVISYDLLVVFSFVLVFTGLVTGIMARRFRVVVEQSLHFEAEVLLKNELEAANRKLEEMNEYKTRFFQNITHEFRTPLTLIMGPVESLLEDESAGLSERVKEQLSLVRRNAVRLLRLINQLLDLAKLDADRMTVRLQKTGLVRFLRYVAATFESSGREKLVDFTSRFDCEETEAYIDREKTEKILFNLLSNAFKFTEAGGKVYFTASVRGNMAEISVTDTGCGIPEGELPFIFDRFRQVDGSSTRRRGGTGIGLALVKEYVTLLGGEIRVKSETGRGSAFSITLPITGKDTAASAAGGARQREELDDGIRPGESIEHYEDDDTTPDGTEAGTGIPADRREKGRTILVVEDNGSMRRFIREALEGEYAVYTASDGMDGLEKVRRLMPDAVISDVMMPRMDGNSLLEELKADGKTAGIPVVLLTARASGDYKVLGLEAGADDFIEKPFNPRELRARIGNIVKIQAQKRELAELNERLRASENTKDLLAGAVVHDIKNYASAISISMKFLLTQFRGDPRISRNVNAAKTACEDIMHLAINLMDIRKSEEGKLEVRKRLVDAKELALMSSKYVKSPIFEEKRILVEVKEAPAGFALYADPALLDRVLGNLFDNAYKYTPQSGRVELGFESGRDESVVYLFNSGEPIPQEQSTALFEKYALLDKKRSKYSKGLGLYFCAMIMEAHSGRIRFEPAPGGNVFKLGFAKG